MYGLLLLIEESVIAEFSATHPSTMEEHKHYFV